MEKEAVILVGGFGTRLKSVVSDVPKPMALINNIPFLAYLLDILNSHDFSRVILAAGYRHEAIESYFGSLYKNLNLIYSIEKEPLGTGGAISAAAGLVYNDHFAVVNGDTFFDVDLTRMEEEFLKNQYDLMVALKPMTHFDRYGKVEITGERIASFNEKKYCDDGLINGGTYLISKPWLLQQSTKGKHSFEKDILEKIVSEESIGYYISDGYFIDIGIPEDYERANRELPGFLF